MTTTLFIFRRDLRLQDNLGLQRALDESSQVIPIFFLDPRQRDAHPYRSEPGRRFIHQSLIHLNSALGALESRLLFRQGHPEDLLPELLKDWHVDQVIFNRDYTPFARRRDEAVVRAAKTAGAEVTILDDALLNPPEAAVKGNGEPYTVFTPFYKNASALPVLPPRRLEHSSRMVKQGDDPISQKLLEEELIPQSRGDLLAHPGDAAVILEALSRQANYAENRDLLAEDATTHLSVFLKFGLLSIRQVYQALATAFDPDHALIRQLYWRDFYSHIAWFFPHVFGHAFKRQYEGVDWDDNPRRFEAWCQGSTGFPIVDAGMRELNATGFMHNRARMITASFLVKDLHLDWRLGEAYFATRLLDYDPALNNGNWQWAASTGCDAQPYFRIFNPWRQQQRFDPQALYIKRWVPELQPYTAVEIHKHETLPLPGYPSPIVQHRQQADMAKAMFKNIP